MIDRCRSPPIVQATGAETAVVWEVPQFSDNSGMSGSRSPGVYSVAALFSAALHLLPALLMNKQDLFRLEKRGGWGRAWGRISAALLCVCVCE